MTRTYYIATGPADPADSEQVAVTHLRSGTVASLRGAAVQPRQLYEVVGPRLGTKRMATDEEQPFTTALAGWGLYQTPQGAELAKARNAPVFAFSKIAQNF